MIRSIVSVLIASVLFPLTPVMGETTTAKSELDALVAEISGKISAGVRSEDALAEDIARLDALYEKYATEKTEETAQILVMKALLYVQVLRDPAGAIPVFEKIIAELPETEAAAKSGGYIDELRKQLALSEGKPFPPFAVKDLEGRDLSLDDYAGKVLLVDFWATWCGPCVAELPNVLEAYEKYRDAGFDIVGISLDNDRNALTKFIDKHEMAWRQFFDGKGWKNELAQKYGIRSIPSTFLLDGNGIIIGKNLRGPALGEAVAAALAK